MIIPDFEYSVNQKKNPAQGRVFVVLEYYFLISNTLVLERVT
jgi:hypothetical protein